MKILLLGGTGAMGKHLVDLLTTEEHEVYVTTRSAKPSVGNTYYIQGNAHDINFLRTNLQKNWDVIVDFMVYSTRQFESRVNFLLGLTGQYIFLSSARVYANSPTPIKENSDRLLDVSNDPAFLSTDEYALTKARQEDILKNSGKKNWTIIRPYITYSENRLQLGVLEKEAWLYRALKGRTIVFSKEINDKVSTLTYGLDVSRGILNIMGKATALGQAFHITSLENIIWRDVLTIYLDSLEKHLGFRPKVVLEELNRFGKTHPARYQIIYDRLYDRRFDNTKINKYTNSTKTKPVKTGLSDCLQTFLETENFDPINWRSEAIKDRLTKEHTPLQEISGIRQKIRYLIFRYIKQV